MGRSFIPTALQGNRAANAHFPSRVPLSRPRLALFTLGVSVVHRAALSSRVSRLPSSMERRFAPNVSRSKGAC
ncbi:hypothetical protein BCR44DRAFT_1430093, partial [Catenaria anguillulae PL171]